MKPFILLLPRLFLGVVKCLERFCTWTAYIRLLLPVLAIGILSNAYAQVEIDKTAFSLIDAEGHGEYHGNLDLNLPVMTVPGLDGLDFPIILNYGHDTRPERNGTWVGLNWSLQLGSVTRSVNNIPDDQSRRDFDNSNNYLLGFNMSGNPGVINDDIAERDGSLVGGTTSTQDYFDSYYLLMPDGGQRLVPSVPMTTPEESFYVDFKTERWKPWEILYSSDGWEKNAHHEFGGFWDYLYAPSDNYIKKWKLTKDDGTEYLFDHRNYVEVANSWWNQQGTINGGPFGLWNGAGSVSAKFSFPVSWDLTIVRSPNYFDRNGNHEFDAGDDGGWVKVSYNDYAQKIYGPTGTERFDLTDFVVGKEIGYQLTLATSVVGGTRQASFGIGTNGNYNGSLKYDFSCPDAIETPTHIAVVEVTDRNDIYGGAPTRKGKKLESITLYRKIGTTRAEWTSPNNRIKKVKFTYEYGPYNSYLVLKSMQEFGKTDDSFLPKYTFAHPLNDNPWRITYPEGGSVSYEMEDDQFSWYWSLLWDRMGNPLYTFASPFRSYFFSSPRNATTETNGTDIVDGSRRIKRMVVDDGMGSSHISTFQYGEGVLSSPDIASYAYIVSNQYAAWHNGSVGYRWIKVVYPDESSKVTYFTTEISPPGDYILYDGTGSPEAINTARECYPDIGLQNPSTGGYAKVVSNVGLRGIVWRESFYDNNGSAPVKQIDYYYPALELNRTLLGDALALRGYYQRDQTHRYITDDLFFSDARTVYDLPDIVKSFYANLGIRNIHKSSWLPLIRKEIMLDGVVAATELPFEEYSTVNGQPTLEKRMRVVDDAQEILLTRSTFAYSIYPDMAARNMVVQPYMSASYRNSESATTAISASRQEWADFAGNGVRQPDKKGVWSESGEAKSFEGQTETEFLTEQDVVAYDNWGNALETRDANNIPTSYVWAYGGSRRIATVRNATYADVMACVFDDLDVSRWSGSYGTWVVQDGTYTQGVDTERRSWDSPRIYQGPMLGDCIVEASLYIEESQPPISQTRGGLAKYVDPNNYVRFEADLTASKVRITARKNGGTYYSEIAAQIPRNHWFHLKGEIEGSNASLFLNGQKLLQITHANVSVSPGQAGLATHDGQVVFDNVRYYPSVALMRSVSYDPVTLRANSQSDENGSLLRYAYDGLGRLTSVSDVLGNQLTEHSYYLSRLGNPNDSFDPANPNRISDLLYRSEADVTTRRAYYSGLGVKLQEHTALGTEDIVTATVPDERGRTTKAYKPYQQAVGHTYDPNYHQNACNYYTAQGITVGDYPFMEYDYAKVPFSRVERQYPPGPEYRIAPPNDHHIKTTYGSNAGQEIYTTPVSLAKVSVLDENNIAGNESVDYADQLGYRAASVVDNGSLHLVTRFEPDLLGNVTQVTDPEGKVSLYQYDTRGLCTSSSKPDAGTALNLYDENGNLRFTRDAAHTGTGANAVNISGSVYPGGQASGNFTLNNRGKVNMSLNGPGLPVFGGNVTLQVKTTSGTVLCNLVTTGTPQSASLILPQGTYSYYVQSTSTNYPPKPYSVQCQMQYPFTYTKYDAFNRVLEEGEYEAASAADFIPGNAYSNAYPSTSCLLTKTFTYDVCSTDPVAVDQRNVKSRLSWVCSYRLGTLALTTFYSYDNMGRVEWVVQKGLGSASKKIYYYYDRQGNVIQKSYADAYNSLNNHSWWYTYDQAGRLATVYSGADFASRVREAQYSCLATGRANQLILGVAPAQTVSYAYTQRDWLKSLTSDRFWETLGYNNVEEIGSTAGITAQYNGNISWMSYSEVDNPFSWGPPISTTILGYGFGYDGANRLTSAKFGFKYGTSWTQWNSYNMPQITYDKNGNIKSLMRYGPNTTLMDNLTYQYIDNTNRLDYIDDAVSSGTFSTDIDDQETGAYAYDGNGNVKGDAGRNMALVIYDMNNLPLSEYKTDGTLIQYVYDANGARVQKVVGGGSPTWYAGGSDGKTDVVYAGSTSNPCYNVFGVDGLLGQVKRTGAALNRSYHLKDHLGSIRVTVRGDETVLSDDFSGTLSQWTTVLGSGFTIVGGELSNSSGGDNVAINASSTLFADGIVGADVTNLYGGPADANIVFRYQDPNNYYMVQAFNTQVMIFKKVAGTYYNVSNYNGPTQFLGGPFKLQASISGRTITVYWKGQQVLNWTDTDPNNVWMSGKVGVRQCNWRTIHWDNFYAITTCPGQWAALYDYYPFGQYMDERCSNNGFADDRYKYTGKERDNETGYDYFGARYYDARVGRWLGVDPLAARDASMCPYAYVQNAPVICVDPDGRALVKINAGGSTVTVDQRIGVLMFRTLRILEQRGLPGAITYSIRSTKKQQKLWELKKQGKMTYAVAPPGTSFHEAGFAVDGLWNALSETEKELLIDLMEEAGFKWYGLGDPVHYQIDAKKYGYQSSTSAISINQNFLAHETIPLLEERQGSLWWIYGPQSSGERAGYVEIGELTVLEVIPEKKES